MGMLVLDGINVLRKKINRVDIWSGSLTAFSLNIHARWKIKVVCLLKQHRIYTKRDSLLARHSHWFLELHSKPTRLLLHYRSSFSLSLSLKSPNTLAPTSLWVRFQISLSLTLSDYCVSKFVFFLAFIPTCIFRNNLLQIFVFLWALIWIILTFIWIYQYTLRIFISRFLFFYLSFRGDLMRKSNFYFYFFLWNCC